MDINFIQHWLRASWQASTAYPSTYSIRTKKNRAIWQCAITALLVQELLWWSILKSDVPNYWFTHYWNNIDWKDLDFTFAQFIEKPILSNIRNIDRVEILSNDNTQKRFEILKTSFDKFISRYEEIEKSVSCCKNCIQTEYFIHNTIYFGKNTQILLIWEAPAKTGWLISGKAWRDKEWKILPSGKVMQQLLREIDMDLLDLTFLEGIKCFPQNRKNLKLSMQNCKNILYSQIDLLKPNILLTLWDNPTRAFLWNSYNKFSTVAWNIFDINIMNEKYKLIPIYHPSPISPLSLKGNIPIFTKIKNFLSNNMETY